MVFCLSNTSHNRLQPGLCQNGVERGHPEEEGLNQLLSQLVGSVIVFFLNKKHDHVWPYDRSHGHARKTIITLQKDVQRGEDAQILCHDMVCLWLWVKAKLEEHFPGEVVQRHQKLFDDGCLRSKNMCFKVMRFCKWFQDWLANTSWAWLVANFHWPTS